MFTNCRQTLGCLSLPAAVGIPGSAVRMERGPQAGITWAASGLGF